MISCLFANWFDDGRLRRALWRAALAAGIFCTQGVCAEPATGNGLPEALKDIKRSDGVCKAEESSAASGASGARRAMERPDFSCGVSATDALAMVSRVETAVVDVRLQAEFAEFHIDRALNLSVAELRGKTFMQGKSILLAGNGRSESELYSACSALKGAGFKRVRVLRGGMPAWVSAGQPVIGRTPAVPASLSINADELWAESQSPGNLVLLDPKLASLQPQLPYSATVTEWSASAIQKVVARRRKELGDVPLSAVVFAAPALSGSDLQGLRSAISVPMLVYLGDREKYEKARAGRNAIWLAEARGPKKPRCGL